FPYAGGFIGVWGIDPRSRTFQDPSTVTDFMGYCDPQWTSDYTWAAIFERTVAVSALAETTREPALLVRVGGDGGARMVGPLAVHTPHPRSTTLGRWRDANGRTIGVVLAPTLTQSHTDERLAVFPAAPLDAA